MKELAVAGCGHVESPEQIYARVVAAVGEDGRLPMPPVGEWEIFPWEAEIKAVAARLATHDGRALV